MANEGLGPANISRRSLIIGGLTLSAAGAAAGLKARQRVEPPLKQPLDTMIPRRLGDWIAVEEGGVVRPPEEPKVKSVYDQELSRVYVSGTSSIMLLIAYGSTQSDTLQVHRPEYCYPAAGFELGERQTLAQPIGSRSRVPTNYFTAIRGDRVEHVLYWVRLGNRFPTSWARQHIARLTDSIQGFFPDGVLVRASVISADRDVARTQLVQFMERMTVAASPAGREMLIGRLR